MNPEETHSSVVIDAIRAVGGFADEEFDDSVPPANVSAEIKPAEKPALRPWQEEYNEYDDKSLRALGDDVYGMEIAKDYLAEGHFTRAQYDAVAEFYGSVESQFEAIKEPEKAIQAAAVLRERGAIDEEKFESLCRGVAHRQIQQELAETARLDAEARREQELADAEDKEADRKAAIRQRAWETYQTALDKLNEARGQ